MGPEETERRSMPIAAAVGWTFGTTFLYAQLHALVATLRPGIGKTLMAGLACQLLAYAAGFLVVRKVHAPKGPLAPFAGARRTHLAFLPIGLMLGVALQYPASALYEAISRRWPPQHPGPDLAKSEGVARVALAVGIVFVGPLLEELFFRGAIFGTLRREHDKWTTILLTGALFAVAHVEPRVFLPIAFMGVVLSVLREESGSLLPSFAAHATFNAFSFWMSLHETANEPEKPIPVWIVVVSLVAVAILVELARHFGRVERARLAKDPNES